MVGEHITARSLRPGGDLRRSSGLVPTCSCSRGGCSGASPRQLEARELRVRLESKGEREQMVFGESGKGFSGSAACWWVPFYWISAAGSHTAGDI